jgi:ketosteroid isomerase-like protein
MSENVDLVRSIYAEWERGDFSAVEWVHPEIEFVVADGPEAGCWTGRAEMAESWRRWLSAWEDFRAEADGYRELDGDRVLVLNSFGGRGKTSGLGVGRLRTKGASVFQIGDRNVTRLVIYTDRAHALGDLGLKDPSHSAARKAVGLER